MSNPHYVLVNYGDGVEASVYHVGDENNAMRLVVSIILSRLGNLHQDDDDDIAFSCKLALLIRDFSKCANDRRRTEVLVKIMAMYHSIPDQLETIDYGGLNVNRGLPTHPLGDNVMGQLAQDYIKVE